MMVGLFTTPNRLLSALGSEALERLASDMERVSLRRKDVLYEPGEHVRHVYFPETAIIVHVTLMQDGQSIESATVGREGVTSISAIFGVPTMPCQTMVAIDGEALKIAVEPFEQEVNRNADLRLVLNHYSHALLIHTMRSTACNGLHPLEQRCARWILTTIDRIDADRFAITHDFLACLLGATRPTVSLIVQRFEDEGYIRVQRGLITVPHRAGLESIVCECYDVIRAAFAEVGIRD
jgi:CRP-like cAMP-binding protein